MDGSQKIIEFPKNGAKSRSNAAPCSALWRPLEKAPNPGQRIEVKMMDGSVKEASVTRMVTNEGVYLQYFHKAPRRRARALDINAIESWRPYSPNAKMMDGDSRSHLSRG